MIIIKRQPLCVNDLRKELRKRKEELDEKKKSCKILIIDDNVDDPDYILKDSIRFLQTELMLYVKTQTDISSLNEVSPYDIVVCDVDGVGGKLNLPDGIDVVKRLQELYSDKQYAIMTQVAFRIQKFDLDKEVGRWDKGAMADAYRNSSAGTLEKKVLKMVDRYADPASRWESIRAGMLRNAMSIHDVAKLESAYVKSILKKNKTYYDKAVSRLDAPVYDNDKMILTYIQTAASVIGTIISIL